MRYCQEKGIVCQYAGTNMHCRLSACIFPKESLYPAASRGGHLMDLEKLIKRLKCPQIQSCPMDGEYPSCKACQKSIQQEVITALSTLQAENEKLKDQLYDGEGVNLVNYWLLILRKRINLPGGLKSELSCNQPCVAVLSSGISRVTTRRSAGTTGPTRTAWRREKIGFVTRVHTWKRRRSGWANSS